MKMGQWHSLSGKEALKELGSDPEKGLSSKEALERLAKYGRNTIESGKKISVLALLLEQFTSPLVLILIFASLVSFLFGKGIDGLLILAIVIANGIFGFVQNYNAERSIAALKKMGAPKALVIRDGLAVEINSEELVPGDIIVLREGAKVPADCRILESAESRFDESILTGESAPSGKKPDTLAGDAILPERKNMVFMNTLLVRGSAKAVVAETGKNTEVGKIATTLESIEEEPTRFHTEIGELSKKISVGIIALVIIIGVTLLGFYEADLIDAIIISISVAVAAIPEGLPAVVTISLAISTRKMLKRNSLVRRLPVIENLGSVDVICTDKTGTLTENSMTVQEVFCNGKVYSVTGTGRGIKGEFMLGKKKAGTEELQELLLCGIACNDTIMQGEGGENFNGDPTEIALCVSALKAGFAAKGMSRVSAVPFSSETKRMTVVVEKGGKQISYAKGAPEVIIESCTHIISGGRIKKLGPAEKRGILAANNTMASKALRVLAFAYKEMKNQKVDCEKNLVFLGLQGMIDPPRPEVAGAIKTAKEAGIRIVLLTGDNLLTAKAIGEQIGFTGKVIDGKELSKLSESGFAKAVFEYDIFARVSPQQKFMVLKVLKEKGHSVAMTGDGVNDAPALKQADVGIAMGIRGSDVSKEASDIVLLDDNFATIIEAIRQGRGVFDNIQKFVNYLVSCNIAEVLIVFVASLAGYLSITAVQLLWINLLTDGLPALALGADEPRMGIMKEPPRKRNEEIIGKELGKLFLVVGISLTAIILAIFFYYLPKGLALAQTMVFTCLVVYEFIRIVVIRKQENTGMFSNKWMVGALLLSIGLQLAVLYTPVSGLFNTVALGFEDWAVIGLGGIAAYFAGITATKIILPKPAARHESLPA